MSETALEQRDYFTDPYLLRDPYAYFEAIRAKGPVHKIEDSTNVIVTGFKEAIQVLQDTENFSAVLAPLGPIKMPFEPEGDDITGLIEMHRQQMPLANQIVTYDGERHAIARSLLNPVFKPSRLKANEEFINTLADEMVREAVAKRMCEVQREIATPYATLVVADLLGVPDDDQAKFRDVIDANTDLPGAINTDTKPQESPVLSYMITYFSQYIMDRQANPRQDDIMTELATSKLSDGSMPDTMELISGAMLLFAAGQDTTAKLLGNALRFLGEDQALQQRIRNDRAHIPSFVEEVLRLEGSVKTTFRLCQKSVEIGGEKIKAGDVVAVSVGAANRDPARWSEPASFDYERPKIREHLAFGRGPHTCIGAALARTEMRIILDRFLEQTSGIAISEAHHGQPGERRYDYDPTYIFRGLSKLHVEFEPA